MLKEIKNDELVPTLESVGIAVKEYSNASRIPKNIDFLISTIPGGKGILLKKGEEAKLSIATDITKKQAVLNVLEKSRTIKTTVHVKMHSKILFSSSKPYGQAITYPNRRDITALAGGRVVSVPGSKRTYSIKYPYRKSLSLENQSTYIVTVTDKVGRATNTTFLFGMDEVSHFVSVLPKKAGSVKEAHNLLRPKEVSKKTLRQGEFFFVATKYKPSLQTKIQKRRQLESGSNHYAEEAIRTKGGILYVRGIIFDKRGYRHAPLSLGDKWHKVVRNNEKREKPRSTRSRGRVSRLRYD